MHASDLIHSIVAGDLRPAKPKISSVCTPYDGSKLTDVELADESIVRHALEHAAKLFSRRDAWISKAERIAILRRAADLIASRGEALALEASHEGGKPLVDSRIELERCVESFHICAEALRTQAGSTVPMGLNAASANRVAFVRHEPLGPVLAFSAFNHPLNLIAHQVGPAIAAGCPVIVKPAEVTPISCYRLVRILHEAGLPDGWCQMILPESRELSGKMVEDSRIALFSFIGSARVGWMLRSRLAAGVRCVLEHGGAAPVIVAEDADLEGLLPGLIRGAFYHAGQVCVSVQRIYAHESIAEELARKMAERASRLKVGDPANEDTDVGPLIRQREVDRVTSWVDEAHKSGAEILIGGRSLEHQSYAPTVLFDPPDAARVSHQEIFGPVACIYPYRKLEDALVRANALPLAFQASVYTRDLDRAMHVSERLNASAVMVNDHTAFRVDWMPFAGLKHSGLGTGGIPYTLHDMQVQKMTVIHSTGVSE